MKQILCTLLVLCSFWNCGFGQINFQGCPAEFGATTYTFLQTTTTNDAGTIRNTYETTPIDGTQACPGLGFGFCEFRIIWSIANSRWEFQLTDGVSFFMIYSNTSPSAPNPPDLNLGTWVENTTNTGGNCAGNLTTANGTLSGDVQNSVGGGAPEIALLGNGTTILDGDVTPSATDDTDFGNINLGNNDVHTFTIDNTAGTSNLTVSSIAVAGAAFGDFVVSGITLPATVANGATTTFQLTFMPSTVGVRNATVTVNNDDADEGTYDYAVRGTGVGAPEINVLGNGNSIVDGDVTPSITDDTDFGNINLGGNDVHTFTVDNTAGTSNLTVSSIAVAGVASGDFAVSGITLPATVVNGATTTFQVTFTPSVAGVRNATVTVNSDDADEGAYDYAVRGTGVGAPEIDVLGNGTSIADGDLTPNIADDTDFGTIALGANDVHTFTVDNTAGTSNLTVSSIAVAGAASGDFAISGITLPATVVNGATTTFQVTFTPSAAGVRNATVTVNNDDADEAIYDFAVTGVGIDLPDVAITEFINNPDGSEATDEWVELFNFGATPVDIQNWRIQDEDIDDDVITTNSFIIPAGGYVILTKNKTAFEAQWLGGCPSANVIEVAGILLANGIDEIIIRDASNNIVWSLAYRNDESEGFAAHYTDVPTFTNRIWGSKASPGVRRNGNDVTTGTLGYEGNNNTADPNVMTSTTGDMGSPFDGTYTPPVKDIVRGDVLDFDGGNDYINIPSTPSLESYVSTGTFTVEMWIHPTSFAGRPTLISNRDVGNSQGFVFEHYSGELHNWIRYGATWVDAPITLTLNEWQHIAVIADENVGTRVYVNGILAATTNATGAFSNSGGFFFLGGDTNDPTYRFTGAMDETRIWNTARTATEIRENMHLTLDECFPGLVAYYQLNDGTGSSIAEDKSGNGNNGALINMDAATDWLPSNVNVGNDASAISNSQTINTPAGVSTQSFTTANVTMGFFAHSGAEDITVTYQAFTPNSTLGADGISIIQNPMWTVNKASATETMVVDYTFEFPGGTFTSTDPTKYSLYHRTMNSEGAWIKIATANAVTTSSATFGKISLSGQFMVVQESENDISDVRGNMYAFDGVDDHIMIPYDASLDFGVGDFTFETWLINDNNTPTEAVFEYNNGVDVGLHIFMANGQPLIDIQEAGGSNTSYSYRAPAIAIDEWTHVVWIREGANIRIYVNGVEQVLNNTSNVITAATPAGMSAGYDLYIGSRTTVPGLEWTGKMDEVRIWNVALTQEQIRENMHLTLKGNEAGLVSYFQFNNDDPVGTVDGVKDAVGSNDGTTQNMVVADYVASEVAVAGGTSDRITIGAGGVYTFPNTDVVIEFGAVTPNGEIVVSRLETEKPTGAVSIGVDVDNEYFVINNYGANATFDPLLDITFDRLSYVSPTDVGIPQATTPLQVYKRNSNDFGATWGTSLGGADNATAGTNAMISFNTVNNITSFSQIVLANNANNSDLPVELMKFDAVRLNADKVQLDWSTATEINNKGFYIERMLEVENKFETVAYVEGQGNSVDIVNYQFLDENSYTGVSYYRLRQVDFDGTTTYSDIRAVEGRDNKIAYMDVSIYPNPVYDELKIRFNVLPDGVKTAQVRITTVDGKVLYDFSAGIQSYQLLEVDGVDQLSAGLYLISIEFDNKERAVHKFVKE